MFSTSYNPKTFSFSGKSTLNFFQNSFDLSDLSRISVFEKISNKISLALHSQ